MRQKKHTIGICNFGMLNYYLGKRAADDGRDSRYPDIDFCKNPGAICDPGGHVELKWIGDFFSPPQKTNPFVQLLLNMLMYCLYIVISSISHHIAHNQY